MHLNVTLLSNFGPEVRGVSHYADQLYHHLLTQPGLKSNRIDFIQAYPANLMPAAQDHRRNNKKNRAPRVLHWAHPTSWTETAKQAASVLHIQYWTVFTSYYLLAVTRRAQARGKKVVLTVHNPTPHESLPLFKYWERRLLQEADALILHTKDGCTQLLKHIPQLCHKRLHVIPHGVTLHPAITISRSTAHETAGLDQNHRYFVTFGNLRGYKGIPVLLRAWREIMDQFPDTYLVIAGRLWDGKQGLASVTGRLLGARKAGAEIQSLLAQPELTSRVIFREGFIAEEIINALCEIAVLAVFPHERMAGQSGAVTRAAGYGVPVLVSNVGGLPTSAMGPHFIVPAKNETALAERLSELLREDLQALRALQIKHVSRFEWGRVAALHTKLYQELTVTTP